MPVRAILCVCLAAAGCSGETEPDGDNGDVSVANFVPPTVTAHGMCDATGDTTRCTFAHEGCGVGDRRTICQKGKSLANPDCAPTAEVAGVASSGKDEDQGGDGDFTFDLSPTLQAAILAPASTPPRLVTRDLRTPASFSVEAGHMHIELQSCRYCRGPWIFPEAPNDVFDGEIHDGDIAAASGNWTADLPQHEGWSEIHEATAVALVHTLPGAVSYILVNAFFVDSPDQRDDLVLDVPVPTPSQLMQASVPAVELACEVDPPVPQRGCPCATARGVTVRATADASAGLCRLQIHRGAGAPPPLPFSCVNTPPCNGGSFVPSPEACANIFFGGVVRASWR